MLFVLRYRLRNFSSEMRLVITLKAVKQGFHRCRKRQIVNRSCNNYRIGVFELCHKLFKVFLEQPFAALQYPQALHGVGCNEKRWTISTSSLFLMPFIKAPVSFAVLPFVFGEPKRISIFILPSRCRSICRQAFLRFRRRGVVHSSRCL